jgi:hypothetical protein
VYAPRLPLSIGDSSYGRTYEQAGRRRFRTRSTAKTLRRIINMLRSRTSGVSVGCFVSIGGFGFDAWIQSSPIMSMLHRRRRHCRPGMSIRLCGDPDALWLDDRRSVDLVFGFIYICGILGEQVRYDLRKGLFPTCKIFRCRYYNKTPVGWIISRVSSDTERVARSWLPGGCSMSSGASMNIADLRSTSWCKINWQLAGIVLTLIVPVIIVIATLVSAAHHLVEYREVRKRNSKITGTYNETITGVRVIKRSTEKREPGSSSASFPARCIRPVIAPPGLSALFLPTRAVAEHAGDRQHCRGIAA